MTICNYNNKTIFNKLELMPYNKKNNNRIYIQKFCWINNRIQ